MVHHNSIRDFHYPILVLHSPQKTGCLVQAKSEQSESTDPRSRVKDCQAIYLKRGEKCVCEIWKELNLPQNLVSHHLKVLKDAKFISSRKEGLKVFYSLKAEKLRNFCCSLEEMLINNKKGK